MVEHLNKATQLSIAGNLIMSITLIQFVLLLFDLDVLYVIFQSPWWIRIIAYVLLIMMGSFFVKTANKIEDEKEIEEKSIWPSSDLTQQKVT